MRWGLHGELPRQAQLFWSASCGTCVTPSPLASSWPASGSTQCQCFCALRRGYGFFIQSETSQWCGTALSNRLTHAAGPFFTGRPCALSWTVQTHSVLPAPTSTKVSRLFFLKKKADRSGVVYVVPFASKCSTLFLALFLFIFDRLDGFSLF